MRQQTLSFILRTHRRELTRQRVIFLWRPSHGGDFSLGQEKSSKKRNSYE